MGEPGGEIWPREGGFLARIGLVYLFELIFANFSRFVTSAHVGESLENWSKVHPRDLEGDLEGHWACALKSSFKVLNFEYNIDI